MSQKKSPGSKSSRARTSVSWAAAPSSGHCWPRTSLTNLGSWSIRSSWAEGSASSRREAIRRRWSSWIRRRSPRAFSISPASRHRAEAKSTEGGPGRSGQLLKLSPRRCRVLQPSCRGGAMLLRLAGSTSSSPGTLSSEVHPSMADTEVASHLSWVASCMQ